MQSIERYGIVSLCFLIVTLVAVWLWDERGSETGENIVQASETSRSTTGWRAGEARQGSKKAARRVTRGSPRGGAAGLRNADPKAAAEDHVIAGSTGVETGALTRERVRARKRALAQAETERRRAEEEERRIWEKKQRDRALAEQEAAPLREDRTRFETEWPPAEVVKKGSPTKMQTTGRTSSGPSKRSSSASGGLRPYVLREGDTLTQLAERELGTWHRWQEIVAINPGLNPNGLPVGVEIFLPHDGASTGSVTPAPLQDSVSNRWVVASGDSLWTIAERHLGDGERWREIERLNPSIDPQRLRVGEVLAMPDGKGVAPPERVAPRVANRDQQRSRSRGKVL